MREDTVCLLKEVNAGTKTAVDSIDQVREYVADPELAELLGRFRAEHRQLGERCHTMLNQAQEEDKEPKPGAKVMTWLSTGVRLALDSTSAQIAAIMFDGCHMGIKSLAGYLNQYQVAEQDSRDLARQLIRLEEEFMRELLPYL